MQQWRLTDYLNRENYYAAAKWLSNAGAPLFKQSGWEDSSAFEPVPFLLSCIVFGLVVWAFECYLNLRQLAEFNRTDHKTPAGIKVDVFTKSLAYGSDKLRFGMLHETFEVFWGIGLLCVGALPWAWDFCRQICLSLGVFDANSSALWIECCITSVFVTAISMHDTVVSFPFDLYKTFVIEQKHGFNKSTFGLWMKDKVMMLALNFVIGTPIYSCIVWLARSCGDQFPMYVWIFISVVMLIMNIIAPTLIMPLFNKYEEVPEGDLRNKIYALADQVSFPLKKLYTMDGSKRSAHSNAFFYGFGSSKMIVLFDTLITQVNEKELLAILGHEIGHWALWHTVQGFVIAQLYTFVLFYTFAYAASTPALFNAFGFAFSGTDNTPVFIGLMLFMQTYWSPVDKVLKFVLNANSRRNEFQADQYSVKLGMAKELSSGLVKISAENLGNMVPDSLYSSYHFSHPPVVERCQAMAAADKKRK